VAWIQGKVQALREPTNTRRRVKGQRTYKYHGSEFMEKGETVAGLPVRGIGRPRE
jgi:hypothetical protein